jgi:hypothetical protein
MAISNKLVAFLFCLKASLSFDGFLWPLMRNARPKIAMMYMWEQNFGTRDDMCMYARYDSYADRYH